MKLLHLITSGRKTGKPHETELYYFDHEDKLVIIASAGGRPNHPDWYLNLRANPRVRVRMGKKEYEADAKQADSTMRKKLWADLIKMADIYDGYQKKTTRVIPMVLLQLKKEE